MDPFKYTPYKIDRMDQSLELNPYTFHSMDPDLKKCLHSGFVFKI